MNKAYFILFWMMTSIVFPGLLFSCKQQAGRYIASLPEIEGDLRSFIEDSPLTFRSEEERLLLEVCYSSRTFRNKVLMQRVSKSLLMQVEMRGCQEDNFNETSEMTWILSGGFPKIKYQDAEREWMEDLLFTNVFFDNTRSDRPGFSFWPNVCQHVFSSSNPPRRFSSGGITVDVYVRTQPLTSLTEILVSESAQNALTKIRFDAKGRNTEIQSTRPCVGGSGNKTILQRFIYE